MDKAKQPQGQFSGGRDTTNVRKAATKPAPAPVNKPAAIDAPRAPNDVKKG